MPKLLGTPLSGFETGTRSCVSFSGVCHFVYKQKKKGFG